MAGEPLRAPSNVGSIFGLTADRRESHEVNQVCEKSRSVRLGIHQRSGRYHQIGWRTSASSGSPRWASLKNNLEPRCQIWVQRWRCSLICDSNDTKIEMAPNHLICTTDRAEGFGQTRAFRKEYPSPTSR